MSTLAERYAAQLANRGKPATKPTNGHAVQSFAAPAPAAPESPCVHRGALVGRITCSTLGSPDVFACSKWPVGGCVLRPSPWVGDQPVHAPGGGAWGQGTYSPWTTDSRSEFHEKIPRLPACSLCEFRQEPPAGEIIVNADENGIGDAAEACWRPEVVFYAHGIKAETVRLFGGRLTETKPTRRLIHEAWDREVRTGACRIQDRTEVFGVTIVSRPPVFLDDEAKEFAKTLREPVKKLIVLAPQSTNLPREWPARHWPVLASMLTAQGYTVVADVVRNDETLKASCTHYFLKQSIQHMAAVINESDLVIASDSGPAQFAGNMDKPTLLLLGPSIKSSFAHVTSVTVLTSSKPCTGCHWQQPYNSQCSRECASLAELSPESVLAMARKILAARELQIRQTAPESV